MTLWTTASTDPCTVVICGMVRTMWCGTCCVGNKLCSRSQGRGRLQSLGYCHSYSAKNFCCPIPREPRMALLSQLADEDLLGPAGARLGSLVAEEEGCNEDG